MTDTNKQTDTEAILPAAKAGSALMQTTKFTIPGDLVNRATADLDDESRSAIRWLHAFAIDHGLSIEELANKLKQPGSNRPYSRDSVYQLLTGRREGGSVEKMVQAIVSLREIVEARSTVRQAEFIETSLASSIWATCEAALIYQRINYIIGESQIGKTWALKEYAKRHNHGQTIYVRMPEGGHLTHFLQALAEALRMSPNLGVHQLRQRIVSAFDDRMLLIVDEIHQCFMRGETRTSYTVVEFIREIFDKASCGVILSGTPVFAEMIENGKHKLIMDQSNRRRLVALKLDPKPTKADLNTFAAHFGLPPATGDALALQNEVIRNSGLGLWVTYLRAASRMAERDPKSSKITWQHVSDAFYAIESLGQIGGRK